MLIRRMRHEDVEAVEELSGLAFAALPSSGTRDEHPRPAESAVRWCRRARHLLTYDPGGAWVAEHEGRVIGGALSLRREGLWGLSCLAVAPGMQGGGVGRLLLERAAEYAGGALRGMICASPDPRAVRLYRALDHRLYPTMRLQGSVDRSTLPVVRHVRDGSVADSEFADMVDWQVRGAPHGPDHAILVAELPMLVAETATGRGYAYLRDDSPILIAGTDLRTARELLWEALGRAGAGMHISVDDVTAEQDWAVEVAVRAGLGVANAGFLCLRGMRPPPGYIPSASYL
jgi:GNAT superfamily N-acetyltransferase